MINQNNIIKTCIGCFLLISGVATINQKYGAIMLVVIVVFIFMIPKNWIIIDNTIDNVNKTRHKQP